MRIDQSGNEGTDFPFKMRFVPHSDVTSLGFSSDWHGEMAYLDDIKSIPVDSNLFEVYGWTGPSQIGGTEELIGTLKLDGEFVTSKWGDENLFFRHGNMEDDLILKPEWADYVPFVSLDGKCPYQI